MGARLRAEVVLAFLARYLSQHGLVKISDISEGAGVDREFVEEILRNLRVNVEDGVIREPLEAFLIKAWRAGYDVVSLALNSGWSDLEALVSYVLREAGYSTYRTVRFKFRGRRFEVDVLAFKKGLSLCVDCKRWKRLREGMLRRAADAQHERCSVLSKALEAGILAYDIQPGEYRMIPVVVSLYEPEVPVYSNSVITSLRGLADLASEDTIYALMTAGVQPISFTVQRRIRLL